jgi:geranylgeranyl pyrophosphate synthase
MKTTGARQRDMTDKPISHELTLDQAMELVEDTLRNVVTTDVTILNDASLHILSAGGKRFRPRLVILSYLACGGPDVNVAINPAAALELVHTASVVHDDINDHGVLRRGRPSVNAIWGRTFALLTGDFLFTKVYELMAPYGDLNVLFSEATTALVEGETLQAVAVKENTYTSEAYMEIIARKTAALFRIGAMMGGRLANASKAQIAALETYGYNIGLAFQIIDDILDIVATEEELGKTSGIDLEQGKGVASIRETASSESSAPNGLQNAADTVKQKLLEGSRLERANLQARHLVELSIDILDALPDSPYRDALIALANNVIYRTR